MREPARKDRLNGRQPVSQEDQNIRVADRDARGNREVPTLAADVAAGACRRRTEYNTAIELCGGSLNGGGRAKKPSILRQAFVEEFKPGKSRYKQGSGLCGRRMPWLQYPFVAGYRFSGILTWSPFPQGFISCHKSTSSFNVVDLLLNIFACHDVADYGNGWLGAYTAVG